MSIENLSSPAAERRAAILNAALEAFARYGFKRTAMEDIADMAGVSRPLLYTHFKNKADVFDSLARHVVETVMANVARAWPPEKPFAEGLADAALAQWGQLFRMVKGSPHGAEMLERTGAAAKAMHAEMLERFIALTSERLGGGANAVATARMLTHALSGLKAGAETEEQLEADIRAFARLASDHFKG